MVEVEEIKNDQLEKRKEDLLPNILDQILLICKEDKNFKVSDELDDYNKIIESSNKKLNHKQLLLEQSKNIENKLFIELRELNDIIHDKRSNLLKELGSDFND